MLKSISSLVEIIYPNICLYCRQRLINSKDCLCQSCLNKIKRNIPPFCLRCGSHIEGEGACLDCASKSFSFNRSWSACLYDGALKELIHKFKYKGKVRLSSLFGRILVDFIQTYHLPVMDIDFILPVPLHKTRMREREYNQSYLLSREIAQHYGIPVLTHGLLRIRNTRPQSHTDVSDRITNVRDAFKANECCQFRNKNVMLIDDLFTTGATLSECSRALKDFGIKSVFALTLAKA